MIENLFILGAGASVDAGAPVMNNFLDRAEDLLAQDAYQEPEEIKELFSVITSLNSIQSKANIDLNNIESVLGLLEMSEILKYPINQNELDFRSLQNTYKKMIAETLVHTMKFQLLDTNKISPIGSYVKFVKLLKDQKEKSAIITFNYDLGIDVALTNERIKFQYYISPDDKKFPLLKLHGSLNWYQDRNDIVTPHYITDFFKNWSFGLLNVQMNETTTFSFDEYISDYFPNQYPNITPFIVPPTWNKTMYHKSISNIWNKASACLSKAKNIFVIGYSLPETDAFFKYLFSLGTNSRTRIRKFCVINPDTNGTKERYTELLGPQMKERFSYVSKTFEHGLEELEKILA